MVAQSATDQALAKQWASMKAGHACFMVVVSVTDTATPEVAGVAGVRKAKGINDLRKLSARFIGGSLLLRRCNMQTPAYLDVALQHGGG